MQAQGNSSIILENSAQAAIQGLKLYGRSSQSGVPSPTNPLWINNAGDSGSIALTISNGGDQVQQFSVSTPNSLPGIPVESGGNYMDSEGRQWVGNLVDFATGKHTLFANKEILVNTPNFTESPDHPGFFIWDHAVGNVYKDANSPCILSFAPYGTVDAECAYINGQQIAYHPATSMTAEEVNALFTKMQSNSVPAYFIGQLASPVESNLSNEQIEAFKQLYTYEPATIVENNQNVWMEVEYEASKEEEPEPDIPEFPEDSLPDRPEVQMYYAYWSGIVEPVLTLPNPTCRHTMLIKKILDPSYELPFTVTEDSCNGDRYLWDLINGTTTMLTNEPKSDMEKYFHLMLGGTVDAMPDPNSSILSYWMNQVYLNKYKKG